VKILALVCCTTILCVIPLTIPVFIIIMLMLCAIGGLTKKDLD